MRKRPHSNLYTKKYKNERARAYAEQSYSPSGYNRKPRMRVKKIKDEKTKK